MKQYKVFFDGYCVLCTRFANILLKRIGASVDLIPMQSSRGKYDLEELGVMSDPDEIILVNDNEVYRGAKAVLFLMKEAGGFWKMGAGLIQLLPGWIINRGYRVVARNRYGWFGKRDTCYIPL
ncbi:thiol-disulfide oxidoreductase DCC family protein [Alkalitalea saponilacus]|uniref:Predicted thiol-disulfide oxidoreductase YuxK, DCC family n=1 Tax=Alkalitalea saponilacus TaxID=889453 RepID=A0A1T5AVH3_9BACT|nr:DCC1-like thiol-disulfide oxidoreductase family protein [Alkalitalea saponilacus]ASB48591.1 thiol-disulfide oxidoreductase [Alkalitalea saponilacus]SKB38583.1 Predicted thiol-disulfide oxidoreductase YuxK, DCC family [Alkalitalea saponilacus]